MQFMIFEYLQLYLERRVIRALIFVRFLKQLYPDVNVHS